MFSFILVDRVYNINCHEMTEFLNRDYILISTFHLIKYLFFRFVTHTHTHRYILYIYIYINIYKHIPTFNVLDKIYGKKYISLLFRSFINIRSNCKQKQQNNNSKLKNNYRIKEYVTSKKDCQKNKLNKHCSKFASKTPTLNSVCLTYSSDDLLLKYHYSILPLTIISFIL